MVLLLFVLASMEAPAVDVRGWALEVSLSAQRAADEYGRRNLRDPAFAAAAAALREGFEPERFCEVARGAFDERSSRLAWDEIRPWLGSSLVRRMESAERKERSVESLLAFEARLERTPPSAVRRELVERLDRASGMSDVAIELQVSMMEAVLSGINRGLPEARRRGEEELRRSLERVRAEVSPRTRERVLVSLLYAYEGVSDEALTEYVGFLESETGLALSSVLLESLLEAVSDASRRTSELVSARARDFGKAKT
jgi:hypothetical protein